MSRARQRFQCDSLSMLQHRALHEPAVFSELLGFLNIHVSEMFRDPSYFRTLREEVVPHLKTYPSLKIWIAGCRTGEELYSLAILFREEGDGKSVVQGQSVSVRVSLGVRRLTKKDTRTP